MVVLNILIKILVILVMKILIINLVVFVVDIEESIFQVLVNSLKLIIVRRVLVLRTVMSV